MKRNIIFTVLTLTFIFILSISAFASYEMIKTEVLKDGDIYVGKVYINDVFICRFYSKNENNLKLKITNVASRLEKFISDSTPLDTLESANASREAIVKSKNDILFTVNSSELEPGTFSYHNTASEFLDNLIKAIKTLPEVKFSETIIVVPKADTVTVEFTGVRNDGYTLEEYDKSIVEIVSKSAGSFKLKGVGTGNSPLYFVYPPLKKRLTVVVKETAGSIPKSMKVTVTGNPATPDVIKEAVMLNLHQKIEARHKAHIHIDKGSLNKIGKLYPNKGKSLYIPVSLTGKYLFKVSGKVYVQIENRPLYTSGATYLMVSDRPETIVNNGKLFEGRIQDYGLHRMLFHHKCYEYSYPRNMQVRLVNDSKESCYVYIIKGYADGYGELDTGFYGGRNYFLTYLSRKGYVIEISPDSVSTVFAKYLKPGEITSGLMNFQVLNGPLPNVIIQSSTYRHSNYQHLDLSEGKEVHPRGIFASPDLNLKYKHYMGEAYTFIDVGNKPFLKEITTGEPCYGNYGVFYNMDISIINDKNYAKKCEILLQARAGPAKAVLLLDGTPVIISNTIYFPNEKLLKKLTVGPKQTKNVKILTFPMAGINYPILILVKSFRDY
ncbi:MAG: hypothetical protein ABIH00_07730 [Armatimonadota bacterium]